MGWMQQQEKLESGGSCLREMVQNVEKREEVEHYHAGML